MMWWLFEILVSRSSYDLRKGALRTPLLVGEIETLLQITCYVAGMSGFMVNGVLGVGGLLAIFSDECVITFNIHMYSYHT